MSRFEPNPQEDCVQMTEKTSACAVRRRSGLPRTLRAQRAVSNPAGNRNHPCWFGVHLADFGFDELDPNENRCFRRC
jgi:hypothetical protein